MTGARFSKISQAIKISYRYTTPKNKYASQRIIYRKQKPFLKILTRYWQEKHVQIKETISARNKKTVVSLQRKLKQW